MIRLFISNTQKISSILHVDECHRGGAAEGSNWQGILDYFDAVKLGLTATSRRDENADSYEYFGDPVMSTSSRELKMASSLFKTLCLRQPWITIPN